MNYNPLKITVWWGIPCKSMVPVFRELCLLGHDVEFVSVNPLSQRRVQLGWQVPGHEPMPLTILDDDWESVASAILERRDGLHIINGIWHDARLAHILAVCRAQRRTFGLLMEAPSNLERGLRRFAKRLLGLPRARYLARGVAKEAAFVMSASGEASKRFRRLGFKDSKIYQFGYFPAFPHRPLQVRASGPFRLLCVGLIEPFKGQDLLLKAIYRLKEAGLPCHCTITGFGSMRDKCIKLRDKLQLQELVEFPGVVEQTELERLFATSDVLVAPGYEEPWGIRVNEGILAGLPVVVSNGVGAHEVVAAMHSGAVFRSASAASLASALDRVYNDLLSDPDSLLARVDRAGETIQPKVVAGYAAEIIRHALSGGAGPKPEAPWMKGAGRSAGKAL